jgi:hypothetical protein
MSALYWFAFVVGAGMFLFSLFSDLTGHGDVDSHADVDAGHIDGHHGADGFKILSLRNATYFLFGFGVSGVVMTWLTGGRWGILTALLSLTLGVLGGALSSLAFGYLRRSDSGDLPGDSSWVGTVGRVSIPLVADGTGKIVVTRASREHELLARPFDETANPERWTSVIVLEMRQGVALVAPNDSSLEDPALPRLGATSET